MAEPVGVRALQRASSGIPGNAGIQVEPLVCQQPVLDSVSRQALHAGKKLPASLTIAMITALAKAQAVMSHSFCDAWRHVDAVLASPRLNSDLRPKAVEAIMSYMTSYKSS